MKAGDCPGTEFQQGPGSIDPLCVFIKRCLCASPMLDTGDAQMARLAFLGGLKQQQHVLSYFTEPEMKCHQESFFPEQVIPHF